MKTYILVINAETNQNARRQAEKRQNKIYKDIAALEKDIPKNTDYYTLDNFMFAYNDNDISTETSFIAYVHISQ